MNPNQLKYTTTKKVLPLCVVSCPIDTFSGYGARSRDFVKALIQSKGKEWDIKILPQRWGETPWNFLSQDDPLKQRFINGNSIKQKPEIWIQITIPSEFQPQGQFNIGVSAGIESTIYPGEFIEGSNRMDLNLVSSKHSKDVAIATSFDKQDNQGNKIGIVKLEKPIEVLFEGLDLNKYYKKSQNSELLKDVPEDFCFLYTGHWLPGDIGEDRKNTGLMIKTFLETFKGSNKKKPALILKTNSINYSLIDRENIIKKINYIKELVSGNLPNIYLLHGEMTDDEMNQLNNDNKVKAFVSFTKGEGYGRPLAEAAITGKPIITTNWSGHLDFINGDYNILMGGNLTPVHESAANQWILKESQWFSVDLNIASKSLKSVFKHYKEYLGRSRKQTQYIKDNWTFNKMAEKLDNLLKVEKNEPSPWIQNHTLKLPKLKKIEKKINLNELTQ
jgi:glycosyltransferase involved in cell wall biosynthesis